MCQGQTTAITSDGRKVILFDDGTWKFVIEDDGKKIILNPDGTWRYADSSAVKPKVAVTGETAVTGAAVVTTAGVVAAGQTSSATTGSAVNVVPGDSATKPVDSVKTEVKPPPKPKPPPNLNCNALVDVQKDLSGEKYVALSKEFYMTDDPKSGFKIQLRKTRKSPIMWTTTILQTGQCIEEEGKAMIVFQDGGRLQLVNDGKANCNGVFTLMFGFDNGKEEILESLSKSLITGMRITTTKGHAESNFTDDNMQRLRAAFGCMPKLQ